jgi:Flp pilus assembly pilin Flp
MPHARTLTGSESGAVQPSTSDRVATTVDSDGVSTPEYALIIALIVVVAMLAINAFGDGVHGGFQDAADNATQTYGATASGTTLPPPSTLPPPPTTTTTAPTTTLPPTTTSPPDTTPPSTPTGATITTTSCTTSNPVARTESFTWDPSTDASGIARYEWRATDNGQPTTGSVTTTTASYTGPANQPLTIEVRAVDSAGNASEWTVVGTKAKNECS